MLNFSEFQDYALMTIPERLPEEYKGAQIRSHEVEKNNGIVLHGITVTPEDSNIAPNVYLDGYFKQYEEGKDLDAIMDQITHTVVSNIKAPEEFGNIAEKFQDFEFVKSNIVMVAVNIKIRVVTRPAMKDGKPTVETVIAIIDKDGHVGDEISSLTMSEKEFNQKIYEIQKDYRIKRCDISRNNITENVRRV